MISLMPAIENSVMCLVIISIFSRVIGTRCSSGIGDNRYGVGGYYRCQGYCDGAGSCDYANNCTYCYSYFSHAYGSCSSNVCQMGGCHWGYANCNGYTSDGCEVNLNTGGGSCTSAPSLGSVCGDQHEGFICTKDCNNGPGTTGYGERWYKVYVKECSNCPADLRLRARLQSPANMDYDLYLYDGCGTLRASSTQGTGMLDETSYRFSDDYGSSDTRYVYIEIRYYSGSSCSNWQLWTKGGCPDGW